MEKAKIWPFVDRIVQARLKDGTIHIGTLKFVPRHDTYYFTKPEGFTIGNVFFTADAVDFVCICIGVGHEED